MFNQCWRITVNLWGEFGTLSAFFHACQICVLWFMYVCASWGLCSCGTSHTVYVRYTKLCMFCVRLKVCVWDWRSVHVYWRSLCVNWRSVCVNWSSVCVNWKSLGTQSLLCWAKVFNTWCQGYRGGTSTTVSIIRKNNRLRFCVPTYVSIIQFGHLSGIRLTTTVTCDN